MCRCADAVYVVSFYSCLAVCSIENQYDSADILGSVIDLYEEVFF